MGRISRLVVAGCVVASLLGACSSNGTGKVAGNKVLSKSDYIAQADAICRAYAAKIDSIVGSSGSGLSFEQQKQILTDKLIPLHRGQLADLRALRPPPADQARVDKFIVDMSQAVNTIVVKVNAAKSIADLVAIHPSGLARFKKEAKAYGMKVC